MIFPAACPLEDVCSELRALYVALNSPVVRQDPLPVGPASAAVALHAGFSGVSVAIRSVRTGQVAFFTTSIDSPPTPQLALDAALSFGEALGFVFDDDEVATNGAGGPAAARLWCELIGETYQERSAPVEPDPILGIPAGPFAEAPREGPGAASDAARALELAAAAAPPPDPAHILSKFRWASAPGSPVPAAERKTA